MEPRTRIPVHALCAGDAIRLHDWELHVVQVDRDVTTAVLTVEFDFPLRFDRHDSVELVDRSHGCAPAA